MRKDRTKNFLGRDFKKERTEDKLSNEKRSQLMSKILSRNTKFEQNFMALLKKSTPIEFQTHVNEIKGKPDLVFMNQRVCVFLDSDFWHGWQYPRWKHLLKNDFWRTKITNNRKRDAKNLHFLKKRGWKVIRIWEHQVKIDPEKAINKVTNSLISKV